MKKLNKISNTMLCLLPVMAMGAAIADAGNDRDEHAKPASMIWNEPAPVAQPPAPPTPVRIAWVDSASAPAAPPTPPRPERPEAPQSPERMMWIEHINLEGDIDRDELRARAQEIRAEALREQFKKFDLDGSGYITQEEFTEILVERAKESSAQMFQRFGDDGTGTVSEESFIEKYQGGRIHVSRGHGARDLSAEDRERIRQVRELAREAAAEGRERVIELHADEIELRGDAMRARGHHVTRTVDEDGNQVIIIKKTQKNDD